MDWLIEFVKRNWKWLAPLFLDLILLVILFFKKKVKVQDFLASALLMLPCFINDAEATGATGEEKLQYVLNQVFAYLVSITGDTLDQVIKKYGKVLLDDIEKVLSTPQKKGETL